PETYQTMPIHVRHPGFPLDPRVRAGGSQYDAHSPFLWSWPDPSTHVWMELEEGAGVCGARDVDEGQVEPRGDDLILFDDVGLRREPRIGPAGRREQRFAKLRVHAANGLQGWLPGPL